VYDISITPKYSLPKIWLKYTQRYAYSMYFVCLMCTQSVHQQTWSTLLQVTLLGVQIVCTYCMHKVCICRLGAHYCILQYVMCTLSAYIVCMKCAFADFVHTILAYTPGLTLSVPIVCWKCVHTYLMHTGLPSVRRMLKVCWCRLCILYAYYPSCSKFNIQKQNCIFCKHSAQSMHLFPPTN
jgi:hypothetical protein